MISFMLDPMNQNIAMMIALALFFALFGVWLVRWLAAPKRNIEKVKAIDALWREREAYRATLERLPRNSEHWRIVRAIVDQIESDLEELGIPADVLR